MRENVARPGEAFFSGYSTVAKFYPLIHCTQVLSDAMVQYLDGHVPHGSLRSRTNRAGEPLEERFLGCSE